MDDLPLYKVVLEDGVEIELLGNPECRQYGALFMMNNAGEILEIFAPGTWKKVARVRGARHVCGHCRRPW